MNPEQVREAAALQILKRCEQDGFHGNGDEPCGICADAARGVRALNIAFEIPEPRADVGSWTELDALRFMILKRPRPGDILGQCRAEELASGERETKRRSMAEEWADERRRKLWPLIRQWVNGIPEDRQATIAEIERLVFGCHACGGSGRLLGDFGESLEPCSHCQGQGAISYPSPPELDKVVYLADGVYAGVDRIARRLWIYLDDGVQKTAAICFEPEVILALEMHLDVVFPKRRKKPSDTKGRVRGVTLWTGLKVDGVTPPPDWIGIREALDHVLANEGITGDTVRINVEIEEPRS